MASPPPLSSDPLGHELLADRLARIPGLLGTMVQQPDLHLTPASHSVRRFVVTGTGSSEAHARFLVHLLNRYTSRAAEFVPLSAFCDLAPGSGKGRGLIVVSQGLSPNAQVAVERGREFEHLVLFTSTTPGGAEAAGKADRAARLRALQAEGVEFVHSPLEEEYATLIRFVGPLAVYVSAHRFVRALEPSALPRLEPADLAQWLAERPPARVVEQFLAHTEPFQRGFYLLAASPLCEFAHNLSYKFLEGLYWSAPVIWDFLQFAHGPFQEVTLQPRPVVILQGPGATDRELAGRTRRMLEAAHVPCIDLHSAAPPPTSILAWEAIFNDLVFQLIRRLHIDQRNWPSKGKDDPLYGFYRIS